MRLRLLLLAALAVHAFAEPPEPKFQDMTLDDKVQIGYGVAVADVDGDKFPDVILADKKQFAWYKNPGGEKAHDPAAWKRYVLAENLTTNDNVCLAAQDIDGDGKCEIAVGAEWDPGDTEKSGAVFYLIPPADRTQKWEPIRFPNVEPTTHRMMWVRLSGYYGLIDEKVEWGLVVVPLHGRGNKNGQGAPVKVLAYVKPEDVRGIWKSEVIDESMHLIHNFAVTRVQLRGRKEDDQSPEWSIAPSILLCGKEGIKEVVRGEKGWGGRPEEASLIPPQDNSGGTAELRFGNGEFNFMAAIEPMHGNVLSVYLDMPPRTINNAWHRLVLTDKLTEGHALACGDVLGMRQRTSLHGNEKTDQIVVGWRGTPGKEGSTIGIHLWTALDGTGGNWRESAVDDAGMACEDLTLADLDGDERLDIVASGRSTHNLKVYFNQTPAPKRTRPPGS